MITATAIRRAVAMANHPAGKANEKVDRIRYPFPMAVGLSKSAVIMRDPQGVAIHNHANGRLNCVSCL